MIKGNRNTVPILVACLALTGISAVVRNNIQNQEQVNAIEKDRAKLTEYINAKDLEIKNLQASLEEKNSIVKTYKNTVFFSPDNVMVPSNITVSEMKKILSGTSMQEYADIFIEVEADYGINSIFIASLCAHESSWGDSNRARNENNLTGYAVYSDSTKGIVFKNKRESVIKTSKLLKDNYLAKDGTYYKGLSIIDINQNYCLTDSKEPNIEWSESITNIGYDLMKKANLNQ